MAGAKSENNLCLMCTLKILVILFKQRDPLSNRLYHLWDQVSSSNYTDDIDHQGAAPAPASSIPAPCRP